ncbi:MAG: hypothetical protein PVH65_02150 [Chloroflexota bacterium]|jgi:hypothetical protein
MSEERREDESIVEAEAVAGAPGREGGRMRALSLLVGGLAEAGDLLREWAQEEAAEKTGANEIVYRAALGLTVKSAERVDRRIRTVAKLSGSFGQLLFAPGRAMANSRPLSPLRRQFDRLVERGQAETEAWIATGQETEIQGRQTARAALTHSTQKIAEWAGGEPAVEELIDKQVARIAPELSHVPQLDQAIQQLADRYIAYLSEHPEKVQTLIQDQGDVYITYLTQNPQQVQTLIQGQSKGLVSEVTDEVRARTVTADNIVETLARSLFRRGKRKELAAQTGLDKAEDKEN